SVPTAMPVFEYSPAPPHPATNSIPSPAAPGTKAHPPIHISTHRGPHPKSPHPYPGKSFSPSPQIPPPHSPTPASGTQSDGPYAPNSTSAAIHVDIPGNYP